MDRDAEREAIKQAVESITRTTGQRPLGWYTRYGPSVNTRELVRRYVLQYALTREGEITIAYELQYGAYADASDLAEARRNSGG